MKDPLSITVVAVFAAIGGAVLTGAVSFLVNRILEWRDRRNAQNRLSLVLIDRVGEFIALERVLQIVADAYGGVLERLGHDIEGDFELNHAVCVRVGKIIEEIPEDVLVELEKNAPAIESVRRELQRSLDFEVPFDLLSNLSAKVITEFSIFQSKASSIRLYLFVWEDFFKTGNRSLLTADQLYQQWLASKELFQSAQSLVASLMKHGHISKRDVDRIVVVHTYDKIRSIRIRMEEGEKIESAMKALEEELDEEE